MKKVILLVFFSFYVANLSAQFENNRNEQNQSQNGGMFGNDSETTQDKGNIEVKLNGKTKYTDFRMFSVNNDTTYIDTTLTLKKDFKFNYIRKDNFELMPFHNQGQTFNKLGYSFENNNIFPLMGMDAKQYNYYKIEDIKYYSVPTPTSEVFYRTGLEQGQVLNAFITMNTSKQFNFSFAYKGLRSLGKYRQALSSHGNFRTTFNYSSKNERYYLKGHFSSFDLLNYENGGLPQESIDYFESNDPNYIDRGRLEVNFSDAENLLEGKRYYINHSYTLSSKKNSIKKIFSLEDNILKNQLDSINKTILKIEKDSITADSIKNVNLSIQKIKPIKKDSISNNKIALDSLSLNVVKKDSTLVKETLVSIKDTLFVSNKSNDSIAIDSLKIAPKKIDSVVPILTTKNKIKNLKKASKVIKDSLKLSAKKLDSILKITITKEFNVGHSFMYETKHYRFEKTSAGEFFGDSFESSISDHTSYQNMENQLYLEYKSPKIGALKAKVNHYNYNYHYKSILYFDDITIPDNLNGNVIAAGADWNTTFGKLNLKADANSIVSGDLTGNSIKAAVKYKKDSVYEFKGFAEVTSKSPSFNKLLYQSAYKNYNWKNNFKNEEIKTAGVEFKLNKWGSIKASYNSIDNYTYFDTLSKPIQASETLNYVKVKAHQYFTYKKFTIDNSVMYQTVLDGESFFNVPQIVTRNTIYFSDYVFKGDPLYLQTGITFKYFTAFKANAYNPLLSEFTLQNDTEIGNFPMLDFFFNMQVQRTRLYLKVENFGASFLDRNYYSAPNYPYRDLTVRFGLVWNFFI